MIASKHMLRRWRWGNDVLPWYCLHPKGEMRTVALSGKDHVGYVASLYAILSPRVCIYRSWSSLGKTVRACMRARVQMFKIVGSCTHSLTTT